MAGFDQEYDTKDNSVVGAGTVAGVGGTLGAIPFINVLSPGITAGFANAGKQATIDQMIANAGRLQGPQYGSSNGIQNTYSGDFDGENFQNPESAQYSLAQDSAEGRSAQLAALQQMAALTDQSATSASQLGRNTAQMDARQLAQSREGAIRQDAMRRGQVGGAADMIARQQAAQAASNQNLDAGMQNAQQSALLQLAGTQAGAGMASQMRGQDQSMSTNNANTINAFNMRNTDARNSTNNMNTQMRNAGQLRNLDARQGFNNNQVDLGMSKLNRNDKNMNSQYGAQMDKYGAVTTALDKRAGLYDKANQDASQAGKEGFDNFKSVMKMMGGGM